MDENGAREAAVRRFSPSTFPTFVYQSCSVASWPQRPLTVAAPFPGINQKLLISSRTLGRKSSHYIRCLSKAGDTAPWRTLERFSRREKRQRNGRNFEQPVSHLFDRTELATNEQLKTQRYLCHSAKVSINCVSFDTFGGTRDRGHKSIKSGCK